MSSLPLININHQLLDESIDAWVEEIRTSQILAFSGGFSAGDEPDGSAKFIVNVLKNEKMKKAVHELLDRDGMIIGICNGFQALVKSGLLPYGRIKDLDENSPTLAHNAIRRHISQMVTVKVVNDESPWLKGMKGQTFTIPISHGEGRFMASEEEIKKLYENGQIATQYIDFDGNIAHGMPFNPNNSYSSRRFWLLPDSRMSFGLAPAIFLKVLLKWLMSLNPTMKAASVTDCAFPSRM